MKDKTIGFIGLGLMGAAMVSRLQDRGYKLAVLANRSREAVDKAVSAGAVEVSTARELGEKAEIILLCMDKSTSVEARLRGEDGLIAGLQAGAIVIDFGTSLPASTRALGDEITAAGGAMLDAPLGRTPAHALDGLLNIMCAGDQGTYDQALPLLKDLGENVFHLGVLGTGHTIKLLNNFYGMTTVAALSEAFALCDQVGVDREQFYQVVAAGPNHSMMMDFVKANAVDGDSSKLAFSLANASKDVGYYTELAASVNVASTMGQATKATFLHAVETGHGDKMVSELVDVISATPNT